MPKYTRAMLLDSERETGGVNFVELKQGIEKDYGIRLVHRPSRAGDLTDPTYEGANGEGIRVFFSRTWIDAYGNERYDARIVACRGLRSVKEMYTNHRILA